MKTERNVMPAKVREAMRDFYESIEPDRALMSLMEVMRMMAKDEMMQECDTAAEEFWQDMYHYSLVLKAMDESNREKQQLHIDELENKVARLTKKKKR